MNTVERLNAIIDSNGRVWRDMDCTCEIVLSEP